MLEIQDFMQFDVNNNNNNQKIVDRQLKVSYFPCY